LHATKGGLSWKPQTNRGGDNLFFSNTTLFVNTKEKPVTWKAILSAYQDKYFLVDLKLKFLKHSVKLFDAFWLTKACLLPSQFNLRLIDKTRVTPKWGTRT